MWKDFSTKFDGTLRSLKRHKDLVECCVNIGHYQRSQNDMEVLTTENLVRYQQYQRDMIDLKSTLEKTVAEEQEKKLLTVKEWLATGAHSEQDQETFSLIRTEFSATAQWIIKNHAVVKWMKDDVPSTPVLWMYGIPGAGKWNSSPIPLASY